MGGARLRRRADRGRGAPEQTDAQNVVSGAVAVLAVVQESGAVARFGEVGEAVGADLEAHLVPGGVAVGRAPGCAVHSLEGRLVGAYVQVGRAPAAGPAARASPRACRRPGASRPKAACRSGRSDPRKPLDADRAAQPGFDDLDTGGSGDLPFYLVVLVCPRRPSWAACPRTPELIPGSIEHLALRLFVVDAPELPPAEISTPATRSR